MKWWGKGSDFEMSILDECLWLLSSFPISMFSCFLIIPVAINVVDLKKKKIHMQKGVKKKKIENILWGASVWYNKILNQIFNLNNI